MKMLKRKPPISSADDDDRERALGVGTDTVRQRGREQTQGRHQHRHHYGAEAEHAPSRGESSIVWPCANLVAVLKHDHAAGDLTIFNIAGNKYRLMTQIHYRTGKIYVRAVLRHAEYSKSIQ